ncbi:MAG: DEAD/DEAH box helicase [Pseudobacteriovorax sp.]|nr:DEAD/DEAH box helicase [Pseudobacteriovorax sp.]
MLNHDLPFAVDIADVPETEFQPLWQHLERELGRDYKKNVVNKAKKLFPYQVRSIELVGEEGIGKVEESGETYTVSFSLPVFDMASGYSSIQCTCQNELFSLEPVRCHHMWQVQHGLAKVLKAQFHEKNQSDQDVSEFLDSLKSLIPDAALPEEVSSDERLFLQLDENGKLSPFVKRKKLDSWTSGRRVAWNKLVLFRDSLERQSAESLLGILPESDQDPELWHVIQAIQDSDCPMETVDQQPIKIVEASLTLKGKVRDESLSVRPEFSLGVSVHHFVEGLGAIGWDLKRGLVAYTKLNREMIAFYEKMGVSEVSIPLEQKDKLFQYLGQLGKKLSFDIEDGSYEKKPASDTIFFRFTPLREVGCNLEIFVKPSPTGSYFAPGTGEVEVLDLSDASDPVYRTRDLWKEQSLAESVVTDLGLSQFPWRGNRLVLTRDDDVVDILDRLAHLNDAYVIVVEWPQHVKKSAEDYDQSVAIEEQPIRLAVGEAKDWFQVEGEIEIDGTSVSLQELLKALRQKRKYIQLKNGQWSKISNSFKEKLRELSESLDMDPESEDLYANPASETLDKLISEEAISLRHAAREWWAIRKKFDRTVAIDESLPKAFKAQLRPYQLTGYNWLNRLAQWGMGACLADDMGLGKTIQTLAVLDKHHLKGPSLVVAPLSVVSNWSAESLRFSSHLRPVVYRDEGRARCLSSLKPGDMVVLSYGLAWRDIEALKQVQWNILVLDEAQNIKNARSKTAKALQSLNKRWALALSGTPIENHLGDLWSLFRTINPSLLGSWERFRACYGFPISRDNSERARASLSRRIQPFILRRLKKDHLKELPPKTEVTLEVKMSEEEMEVYQALRLEALDRLDTQDDDVHEEKKRLQILSALTRLRQASCHPSLVYEQWNRSSSKLELFIDLVKQLKQGQHKVLVFSQFTRHLKLVKDRIEAEHFTYEYLDGSSSLRARQEAITNFQAGHSDMFLISLKAGGTGITLTEADYVVHLDPWWNPAVEDQATDRAYRLGQTKAVTVYRLVSVGTIEEQVMELHKDKRDLATSILAGSGSIDKLSMASLRQLISGEKAVESRHNVAQTNHSERSAEIF